MAEPKGNTFRIERFADDLPLTGANCRVLLNGEPLRGLTGIAFEIRARQDDPVVVLCMKADAIEVIDALARLELIDDPK